MAELGAHRAGLGLSRGPLDRKTAARVDSGQVLVVARSRVNLIVVSEIVNRCGLRAIPETIDGAAGYLRSARPGLVIVDGGPDNFDCRAIYDVIAELQRTSETGAPRVILLSSPNGTAVGPGVRARIDETVVKPITLDRLLPVVERLARGKA